jgi:hypothetical protein
MAGLRRWSGVSVALAIGGAYDATFALLMLAFAEPVARLFGLPLPADLVYFKLNAILLLILAALYLAAAREPERYRLVAPLSGAGRVAGFVFFVWAWRGGRPPAFLALGVADLAIGLATLAVWRRASALSS